MSLLLAANDLDPLAIAAVIGAVVVLFILLIIVAVFANYFRLWIQSFLTGAGISIFDLIGMTFRKVNKDVIVKTKIMAVQAGAGGSTKYKKNPGGVFTGGRGFPPHHRPPAGRQQGNDTYAFARRCT